MTKLEFINKEIETEKRKIKINTSLVSHFDKDDDVANEVLSNNIKKANDRLKMLEQIKNDLEAWEVVKHSISKEHLEDHQIRTMYGENPFMNINENEKLIINKALEVEDE